MSVLHRVSVILTLLATICHAPLHGYSNITSNDPEPLYSARYPYEYLSAWKRDYYRDIDDEPHCETFTFSITPFRQNASSGRNIYKQDVFLGDLHGRWNMLGLFYFTDCNNKCGTADPCNLLGLVGLEKVVFGSTSPGTLCSADPTACPAATYICPPPGWDGTYPQCPEVLNPNFVDTIPLPTTINTTVTPATITPNAQVGFFAIPLQYRKYGVRFEADIRIWRDIGFRVQTGAANISQTVTQFMDLTQGATQTSVQNACNGTTTTPTCPQTCTPATGCFDSTFDCKQLIVQNIMRKKDVIFDALGYDISDYTHAGAEDTRLSLYWQRLIPVNDGCAGWPFFLCVPVIALEVVVPTAHTVNARRLFALPLGNNGHTGIGFTAGFDFDFVECLQAGIHAGMTSWSTHCHTRVPVPTNRAQSGVFPFTADLNVKPGTNWTFSATLQAHYFLDRLSAYGEYFVVNHGPDCFNIINFYPTCGGPLCNAQPNSNLNVNASSVLIKEMRELSAWRTHLFNFSLTYDISPHAIVGFAWQSPIGRTNSYRSTTVLFSFTFRF